MRTAFAVLCSCVLLSLGVLTGPASAGEYYNGNGYYHPRRAANVWYSSSCCYRKIVKHIRKVHYVRVEPYRSYGDGYYDRPYRHSYYGQPYRHSYYARPHRYSNDYYDAPPRHRYVDYYDAPRYNGGYDAYSAAYAQTCYQQRVRVPDGYGGWVWGSKTVCN